MNVRIMILMSAFTAAIMASPAAAPAAGQTIDLKLSTFQPLNNHYTLWLQKWADTLQQQSGQRMKGTVYPSGQLGAMPRQYDLARTGIADVAVAMHGGTPGRFPLSELSHIPFIVPDAAAASMALTELLPDYLGEEHKGVKVLALSTGTPLALLTTKVAVRRPEDLKGLRIRHPDSVAAATLAALGAVPVYTETAQIADAMSKGTIDGALLAWEALESFQVNAKYAIDWDGNVTTFALVMNLNTYARLPPDLQAIIDGNSGPAVAREIGKIADDAAVEGKAWARKNGMEVIELSAEERKVFEAVTRSAMAELIADKQKKGLRAEQMVASFKQRMAAAKGEPQ